MLVLKPSDRVRGPELWNRNDGQRETRGAIFYPGLGPLEEVKPYILLNYIGDELSSTG